MALLVVVACAFLLLPAMRAPLDAWRWRAEGVAGEAMVSHPPDVQTPVDCSAAEWCWERPNVIVDLSGAPARPELLLQDPPLAEVVGSGDSFFFGVVDHRVPDAAAVTPRGGTFPVWFLLRTGDVTSEEPVPVWRAVLVSWGWILVLAAAIAVYSAVIRRRTTGRADAS